MKTLLNSSIEQYYLMHYLIIITQKQVNWNRSISKRKIKYFATLKSTKLETIEVGVLKTRKNGWVACILLFEEDCTRIAKNDLMLISYDANFDR